MDKYRMPKIQIIFTMIILIALVGWFVVVRTKHVPVVETPAAVTQPVGETEWPSLETKKQTISDSNQYYSIDAAYPATKDPRISSSMKAFIDDQITQFKSDTSWAIDPATSSAAEGSLSLGINYTEQKSTRADNYIFDISTYTGGAHGLEVNKTFSYDKNGKLINLADLFTNGEAGLKTIAPFVQSEITKKNISDPDWIKDGAAATAENYQSFVIADDGITFIFDAYQVAPYAAGTQKILVPVSVFKSIANPDLFAK